MQQHKTSRFASGEWRPNKKRRAASREDVTGHDSAWYFWSSGTSEVRENQVTTPPRLVGPFFLKLYWKADWALMIQLSSDVWMLKNCVSSDTWRNHILHGAWYWCWNLARFCTCFLHCVFVGRIPWDCNESWCVSCTSKIQVDKKRCKGDSRWLRLWILTSLKLLNEFKLVVQNSRPEASFCNGSNSKDLFFLFETTWPSTNEEPLVDSMVL